MSAYYNENDKRAAAWIGELMKEGLIAEGDIDTRSIEDVVPNELRKYTQLHFFAGIAVWSHALRQLGWPDDRRIITGSCPCQPYSSAGKRKGFTDKRHLWPSYFHIIHSLQGYSEFRAVPIVGEQVSSMDILSWFDLVCDDLEGAGYTVWPLDFPACSVGSPQIRNRLYFVACTASHGIQSFRRNDGKAAQIHADAGRLENSSVVSERRGEAGDLVDSHRERFEEQRNGLANEPTFDGSKLPSEISGLANCLGNGWRTRRNDHREHDRAVIDPAGKVCRMDIAVRDSGSGNAGILQPDTRIEKDERNVVGYAGSTNGFWSDSDWVYCNDLDGPRWRPIKPGTFPLADGPAGRVVLLRGAGNAIVPQAAIAFLTSYLEATQ